MSLKSLDKPEKNLAVLEILIEKKGFDETVTKIYRKKAPQLSVPGFRKGKAPRPVVEKMYGTGIFYEDAINELMPDALEAAIKESGIEPVSRPEIDLKDIGEDGVIIEAKLYTKPEVELKEYKGLEVTKTIITVSDEDIDKEIGKIRERNARSIEVTDRAAQNGDTVILDFEGFIDGVPFEGGKGTDHELKLGSGQFIPGFEQQIEGKNNGDEFDVNVTFPETYNKAELAGRPAVFKCVLNEIRYDELPELDDEFAQDVSVCNTFAEYRAEIKTKLEEANNKRSEFALEEQLVDVLTANLEADIPECMFEDETDNHFRDYAYRLQSQGINIDLYMQYTGQDIETVKNALRPNAVRQVKMRLALEKIIALENIEASEEDAEEEYKKLAETYKMEIDEVKKRIEPENMKKDLAVRKAVEFIKENANIKTEELTAEEFAAKHAQDTGEPDDFYEPPYDDEPYDLED
ncbi:MAG: trigger factor [Oscillospiraceae bacterium]|nr:trigger factor [Oscillospiraceae bacterium]